MIAGTLFLQLSKSGDCMSVYIYVANVPQYKFKDTNYIHILNKFHFKYDNADVQLPSNIIINLTHTLLQMNDVCIHRNDD